MIAAVFVSCKKNESSSVQPDQQVSAEVSFSVNKIIPEASREDFPFGLPECSDTDPVTADIVIKDGTGDDALTVFTGTVDLFTLPGDDNLYTQAIKLDLTGCDPESAEPCCNTFYVTEFYVKNADGVIIYAAPAAGSEAQGWLDYPERMLNREIEICEFKKFEFDIDVLCYEEEWYEYFGFFWLYAHKAELREICFFGDVCLKSPYDYELSDYANQVTFPSIDVPAIIEITVQKLIDGVWVEHGDSPYTNDNQESGWGVGAPLCIPYTDYLDQVDTYKATLKVMLKQGEDFPFIYMDEWIWLDIFEDEEDIDIGPDNIVDFVIGNCIVNGADYVYAPWMNLPETLTMELSSNGWSGQNPPNPNNGESYWDARFTGFGAGYDIHVGDPWYEAYCGDVDNQIGSHTYSETYVFSSLEPASNIPSFIDHEFNDAKMKAMTYLANHWNTEGINNDLLALNGTQVLTVQQAIWMVANSTVTNNPLEPLAPFTPSNLLPAASRLGLAALDPDNYENYEVLPGGYTFIMFFAKRVVNGVDVYDRQLILITVDP